MLTLLFSTILLVFMRAMQQQNVIHRYYWWAAFTSYMIAIGEVVLVYSIAQTGWSAIPWVGTGGAIGVTLSMYVHHRFIKK